MDLRLTETAKDVLGLARKFASRNGSWEATPEYLFLALLHMEGRVAEALRDAGVDVARVRLHLEESVGRLCAFTSSRQVKLSDHSWDVLRLARFEADDLGRDCVGLVEMLLGLLADPEGPASHALIASGSFPVKVRQRISGRLLGRLATGQLATDSGETLHGSLAAESRTLLDTAQGEAERQDYRWVQPHHLILALLADEDGLAAPVLRAVDLDPAEVREEAGRWIAPDTSGQLVGRIRISTPAVTVLRRAAERACIGDCTLAEASDILFSLLESGDPCLPTILERFHVPARDLVHELLDLGGADSAAILREAAAGFASARTHGRQDEELDRAISRAREEASRAGADHLGAEHLLLGLALDERNAASRALAAMGVEPCRVREAVSPPLGSGVIGPSELPLAPAAERALHVARLEARHLDHDRVGTGHLLLALCWQRKETSSHALRELGVSPHRLRKEVLAATSRGDEESRIFPPLTTRARAVLREAARSVTGPAWPAVDVGDLGRALSIQGGGTALAVMERIKIDPKDLPGPSGDSSGDPGPRPRAFAPGVRRILTTAWEEAEREGLAHVGTGHLLYGLAVCRMGWIAALLGVVSLHPERIRLSLVRLIDRNR